MKLIGPSPFNSHFFSQLALPNGRAGERKENWRRMRHGQLHCFLSSCFLSPFLQLLKKLRENKEKRKANGEEGGQPTTNSFISFISSQSWRNWKEIEFICWWIAGPGCFLLLPAHPSNAAMIGASVWLRWGRREEQPILRQINLTNQPIHSTSINKLKLF